MVMENNFYNEIKNILISARNKVYKTANFAMVEAYWNIGKRIIDEQGGKYTAEYGQGLLQELSKQMTKEQQHKIVLFLEKSQHLEKPAYLYVRLFLWIKKLSFKIMLLYMKVNTDRELKFLCAIKSIIVLY